MGSHTIYAEFGEVTGLRAHRKGFTFVESETFFCPCTQTRQQDTDLAESDICIYMQTSSTTHPISKLNSRAGGATRQRRELSLKLDDRRAAQRAASKRKRKNMSRKSKSMPPGKTKAPIIASIDLNPCTLPRCITNYKIKLSSEVVNW